MIKVENIEIKYGNEVVVNESNLYFPTGSVTAIIGESGCGKSRILNKLALNVKDTQMKYYTEFQDDTEILLRNHIYYIMQDTPFVEDISCLEQMRLIGKVKGEDIDDIELNLILSQVRLSLNKNTYPKNLSGGEKQRFAIALGLAKKADIIICDEMTSSLDETNTQSVMDILKTLALSGKTVIISSHNQEIYQQCDLIYEIKDKTISLIKNVETCVVNEVKERVIQPIKIKYFIHLFFHKIKRQKVNYYIYLIILSIMIGMSCTGLFMGRQYMNQLNGMKSLFDDKMSYLYKNRDNGGYLSDSGDSFDSNEIEKIQLVDSIDKVYPNLMFIWRSGLNLIDNPEERYFPKETIVEINHEKTDIGVEGSSGIFPIYQHQNMDYSCIEVNKEVSDGIYLHYSFASKLGIESIRDKTTIAFDIYVPVGRLNMGKYKDSIVVDKIRIEKEVRGILHPSYSTYFGNSMYMDYDEMNTLYLQKIENIDYSTNISPYQFNLYSIFTKEATRLEDVKSNLQTINNQYQVDSLQSNVNKGMAPLVDNEKFIFVYTVGLIIVTLLVSIIYSIFNDGKQKKDIYLLKRLGIMNNEINKMLMSDILCNTIVLMVMSTLVSGIALLYLNSKQLLFINQFTQSLIYLCIFVVVVLSVLCSIGSYVKTLLRGKRQ